MKVSKLVTVMLLVLLSTLDVTAQEVNKNIKNATKVNSPKTLTPIYPKMDATVNDLIAGAELGIYRVAMTSLTLVMKKHKSLENGYSTVLVNSEERMNELLKFDDLTVEFACRVKTDRYQDRGEVNIKIYTTKLGGQKMTIYATEGPDKGATVKINNVKISKKSGIGYVLTGDSENSGRTTNYIIHIYKYVQT